MKKLLLLLSGFFLFGCAMDNEEELANKMPCGEVSFATDIQPIIQTNCAVSGCHVPGTGLPDYTDKQVIFSLANKIKTYTSQRIMPPADSGIILTQEEIDLIACWVDDGAQDN